MAIKLSVKNSCDSILKSVRKSCLNFSMQETPFSIYITVRKSLLKVNSAIEESPDESEDLDKANLKLKLESTEEENKLLHQNLEKLTREIKDNKSTVLQYNRKIRQ